MREVPLELVQDNFEEYAGFAASGETVVVTHNYGPYLRLVPPIASQHKTLAPIDQANAKDHLPRLILISPPRWDVIDHEKPFPTSFMPSQSYGIQKEPLYSSTSPFVVPRSEKDVRSLQSAATEVDPNSERLHLLLKKHGFGSTQFTKKDADRLAFLTERIRQLSPAVSKMEWSKLERLTKRAASIQDKLESMKSRRK